MIQALYKREQGLNPPKLFPRWSSSTFCKKADLSFKSFEKIYKSSVNCLELETNEFRYLLTGYSNGGISIFDVEWRESFQYPSVGSIDRSSVDGHAFTIDCLQWYPYDTGMFMSLSGDQTLKIWDTNELRVAERFRFKSDVYNFHMSQNAKEHSIVAVASKDKNIYMCDLKSGSKSHVLQGHDGPVLVVKWSPRNEYVLCSGATDGHIYMWDCRKAKSKLASFSTESNTKVAHKGNVTSLCFLNDGFSFLSFGTDDRLKLWDVAKDHDSKICYGFASNSAQRTVQLAVMTDFVNDLVLVPTENNINLFEIYSGEYVNCLSGHFMNVNCCCFNPTQNEIYSGSSDRQILAWNFSRNSNDENEVLE